ncbi:sister chromatid cohesion 1 protein 3 [Vicia villosa]|uniref:sister chromatid cohesion 1 protein 3 n=1 Tax=Vicia villosa TaxID=3911 RepID=UPI00273AA942|nr:sister chromatid cohesion 1 protein 3 [Vicia villosa]
MFYSQTFLARKGRLSTVWIAAHLQHRLKKSQCTSTDIPSTVQHIMDPGVPIALRMSAHLLLGVVRIYSKKVDYLLNDCNIVRTVLYKVFAAVSNHTLPEDGMQAPVHTITMPSTFELDALSLSNEMDVNGYEDHHMKSVEDITLPDQNPTVQENYVTIRFDEDATFSSPNTQPLPDSDARPIVEDFIPQSPGTNGADFQDAGPRSHSESHATDHSGDGNVPITEEAIPVENIRDAITEHVTDHDYDAIGNLQNSGLNDTELNKDLNQNMNEKDPIPEMIDETRAEPSSIRPAGPSTPITSHDGASDAQVYGGQNSEPTLAQVIPSAQPEQVQDQRQQRGRKRKQFFDDPIVLTNRFMRENLNNTRNILRKRKDGASSPRDTWKLKNKRLKENFFDQPLFTGVCNELLNIHNREYISSKPHLVISEEDHMDSTTSTPPINQIVDEPMTDAHEIIDNAPEIIDNVTITVEETENVRSVANPPPTTPTQNMDTELIIEGTNKSPVKGNGATPTSISEASERPYGATSPRAHISEIGSPSTCQDTTIPNYDMSDFPDTNILNDSAEKGEFWFLEEDNNNTPATTSSQSTSTTSIGSLTGRARGLAKYLQDYSPCTPIPEQPAEDFSLNKMLEGKTRKIAARMFFEVLVLKTHDLIDVNQEEPYGDVSFKLTPTLSNAKI